MELEKLLSGGDLRSLGKSNVLRLMIKNQKDFDELFKFLFHGNRIVVMRAADVIEKITISKPDYVNSHKKEIFLLSANARDKELLWHLALLIPRLQMNKLEFNKAWNIFTKSAKNRSNSHIVRVNSLQGLFELSRHESEKEKDLIMTIMELERENIPSLNARIKKIRKQMGMALE